MEPETERRRKIKVAFFIASMDVGGAERVVTNIIKNIDRRYFLPVLVLFSRRGELLAELPADLEIHSLKELKGKYWYGLQWLNLLRQFCGHVNTIKPDVLISFTWYPNGISIIARMLGRLRCRIIVSERTSTFRFEGMFPDALRTITLRYLYPRADLVIAPSKGIADRLASLRRIGQGKIVVIHNPVEIPVIKQMSKQSPPDPWFDKRRNVIVSVGRLGPEKGFDYLIRAIALLVKDGIDCSLVILGEGIERPRLQALAGELGIAERVSMPGFRRNPYSYMSKSALFVLSSLIEGFPNVLLEAMSLGVPSVATRCPTGPEEMITDGVDGVLVPPADAEALAGAVGRLLRDEDLRKRLGEAGEMKSRNYRVEEIVGQYEDEIRILVGETA